MAQKLQNDTKSWTYFFPKADFICLNKGHLKMMKNAFYFI